MDVAGATLDRRKYKGHLSERAKGFRYRALFRTHLRIATFSTFALGCAVAVLRLGRFWWSGRCYRRWTGLARRRSHMLGRFHGKFFSVRAFAFDRIPKNQPEAPNED
jgi:hypothetical protein